MGKPDEEAVCNNSNNETLESVIAQRLSRRGFLGSGIAAAAVSLSGISALLSSVPSARANNEALLGFTGIPVSSADTVVVPPGYTAKVLIAWGDPVSDGPAFKQD